jgi:ribose 5-phosphate isomerase A
MIDHKKEAARAAAAIVSNGQTIGLGAGATIAWLVEFLAGREELKVVSSSLETHQLLLEKGFDVLAPSSISRLDLYFDGCDVFDPQLNALKSGAGIHVMEKLLASAADQFILLGDAGKYQPVLNPKYPIAIEFLPPSLEIVRRKISLLYPQAKFIQRAQTLIADVYFDTFPDLQSLDTQLNMVPGIVGHSLFYRMAHQAIISGDDGIVRLK